MIRIVFFTLLMTGFCTSQVMADILPAGHKSVSHQLVFQHSNALEIHRIVAAPIAGFSGHVVVRPDEPFHFSSKYGTRIYVIPASVVDIPKFDRELFEQWPNASPPCSEIKSAPVTSPLESALTTLKLTVVGNAGPEIERIHHQEFNAAGREISELEKTATNALYMGLPVVAGLGVCTFVYLRRRSQAIAKSSAS